MSLKLPASNHPARELFDVAHLAECGAPVARVKLPTLQEAQRSARSFFLGARGVKALNIIVLRATGDLHLMSFGPRGGFRTVWNFGQ